MLKIGYSIDVDILFNILNIKNDLIARDIRKGFNTLYVKKHYIEQKIHELLKYNTINSHINAEYLSIDNILLFDIIDDDVINYTVFIKKLEATKTTIEDKIKIIVEQLDDIEISLFGDLKVIKYNKLFF
jgi:hypothetical protein